ncbi:MAG: nucleoside diphosphate kinase regulator [Synergistales bacterium]|nr:nucleoside diphosphate kinase regulator [Synergistales bacterium]
MERRTIYISAYDRKRLMKLIRDSFNNPDKNYLKELEKELNRGTEVEPKDMPPDVITMNSRVRLRDLESGEEMMYILVFPEDADFRNNKISVLAPIGTALLGYRVGDIIEWKVPKGIRKIKVEELLYQPEAAGDFHL